MLIPIFQCHNIMPSAIHFHNKLLYRHVGIYLEQTITSAEIVNYFSWNIFMIVVWGQILQKFAGIFLYIFNNTFFILTLKSSEFPNPILNI